MTCNKSQATIGFIERIVDQVIKMSYLLNQLIATHFGTFVTFLLNEIRSFRSDHICQILTHCLLQMTILKARVQNLCLGIPYFERLYVVILR